METSWQVLVVDDDDDQLSTLRRGLLYLGHSSVDARTAGEALALLTDGSTRIDLVIIDLSRAGKPGAALVAHVARVRPALVLTGLAGAADVIALGVPLLAKPFTPEELGNAIRKAMTPHDGKKEDK